MNELDSHLTIISHQQLACKTKDKKRLADYYPLLPRSQYKSSQMGEISRKLEKSSSQNENDVDCSSVLKSTAKSIPYSLSF